MDESSGRPGTARKEAETARTEAETARFCRFVEALPEGSKVTEDEVAGFCRERSIRYDRDEDEHYDTASAFIKSMRGNDPDAALYWLAKMLAGGEDPNYILRRLTRFAAEDIGLAEPDALPRALGALHTPHRRTS